MSYYYIIILSYSYIVILLYCHIIYDCLPIHPLLGTNNRLLLTDALIIGDQYINYWGPIIDYRLPIHRLLGPNNWLLLTNTSQVQGSINWTNCKDTVASLNWTAVRALEAFVAAKCVEFWTGSNGNTPRPPKINKQIQKWPHK